MLKTKASQEWVRRNERGIGKGKYGPFFLLERKGRTGVIAERGEGQ